jgi:hypothetical protein
MAAPLRGDGADDVHVGAAPAQVAGHPLADLSGGERRLGLQVGGDGAGARLGEHGGGRAELARRAVSALERVVADEGVLQGVHFSVGGQALDGGDGAAVVSHGQGQAGVGPPSVDQHGARAALAVIAALLRSGQAELLAEQVEQGRPRIDGQPVQDAVDVDGDLVHAGVLVRQVALKSSPPPARASAKPLAPPAPSYPRRSRLTTFRFSPGPALGVCRYRPTRLVTPAGSFLIRRGTPVASTLRQGGRSAPAGRLLHPFDCLPGDSRDQLKVLVEVQDGELRAFGCRRDQQVRYRRRAVVPLSG